MKQSLGPKSLGFPAPVVLVGSYDRHGTPNIMTAAWVGICCSSPPCVSVALRRATLTYQNITDRKGFTINTPGVRYLKQVDYAGVISGAHENKFVSTGLTPVHSDLVDAPYVDECPLVLECKLVQAIELGLHTQFIGEVVDVKADSGILDPADIPDLKKLGPILYAPGMRTYFALGESLGKAHVVGRK